MSAVNKGFEYEENVVRSLQGWGFTAYRTNKTNPDDPREYKHGFDGGVDIIARYKADTRVKKELTFYIQCKCQKKELTKSAISEVYAGMHARKVVDELSYAVVVGACDASQETIQFAKSLGVELILIKEREILKYAMQTRHVAYSNYGPMLKIILYHYTKDRVWLDTLPENRNPLADANILQRMFEESKTDFNTAQSYLDNAINYERKANEARQKAIDIQKLAVFRALQATGKNGKERKDTPQVIDDTG